MDILPTLVQLASGDPNGAVLADRVDGRSLVPFLLGKSGGGSDAVLGEILCEGAIAPCFMVRRGRYKYIFSEPDPEQLYDLESDPHELENLADQPDRESLRRSFFDAVTAYWDPQAIWQDVIASQRRRHLAAQALKIGRLTPWDFQPYQDASQQYMRNHMELDDLERRARFPKPEIPPPDSP
jgi:choline-sulfatase